MKATPEVVMQREVARAAWTITNFLRWMRREFSKPAIDEQPAINQSRLDKYLLSEVVPKIKTVGGMGWQEPYQFTPLSTWRKVLARQHFSS